MEDLTVVRFNACNNTKSA